MHPVDSSLLFLLSFQSRSYSLSTIPLSYLSIHSTAFTHFSYFTTMMSKSSHCLSVCLLVCLYARVRQHGTALRVFCSTSDSRRLCHHPVPLLALFLSLSLFQLMSLRPLHCSPSTLLSICCSTLLAHVHDVTHTHARTHDGRYARCMSCAVKNEGNATKIERERT